MSGHEVFDIEEQLEKWGISTRRVQILCGAGEKLRGAEAPTEGYGYSRNGGKTGGMQELNRDGAGRKEFMDPTQVPQQNPFPGPVDGKNRASGQQSTYIHADAVRQNHLVDAVCREQTMRPGSP